MHAANSCLVFISFIYWDNYSYAVFIVVNCTDTNAASNTPTKMSFGFFPLIFIFFVHFLFHLIHNHLHVFFFCNLCYGSYGLSFHCAFDANSMNAQQNLNIPPQSIHSESADILSVHHFKHISLTSSLFHTTPNKIGLERVITTTGLEKPNFMKNVINFNW